MEEAETVPAVEEVVAQEQVFEAPVQEEQEQVVPLSALQKMRKRAQEAEYRAQLLEEQQKKQAKPEEDDSYESLTKGEFRESVAATEFEIVRKIEEKKWVKENSEKFDIVNERLPKLLKLKPHLAYAIANSQNRYEDAWDMLVAFDKEQKTPQRNMQRKEAPGSPSHVPKAAGLNESVDVMGMSDEEFVKWRATKKRRRS